MPIFDEATHETAPIQDTSDATVIRNVSVAEVMNAIDTCDAVTIFAINVTEAAEAADSTNSTVFYWRPRDNTRHLERKSIHDVLTDRDVLSDPTMSHELLRSQNPRRRC